LKLTPLNIITSASLVIGGYLLFSGAENLPVQQGMNGLVAGLCFLSAIIAFISDLIFRKFIPLLRNLWVVECAFIVFTIVLTIVLKLLLA
jgi:hypothetical protein